MIKSSKALRELLRILIRDLDLLEKNDSSCCGVTLVQCHALVEIGRKKSLSLNELANILQLDKSTMSRTINNLVESSLVHRDIDPTNRRYVSIHLTKEGVEIFNTIEESMNEYYNRIFKFVPVNKQDQVLESLQILTDAIILNKQTNPI
ncbi:MAG: MarR family transcriptional regulator [Vallitaleaceae bacterium]|nr:MarR family transcriptional regulator [Vallitaleaceae bacterium]